MAIDFVDIDFFVVGAMKAATSSLCEWLHAQPGISISNPKEPGIFVSEASVKLWESRLHELYREAPAGTLLGEGSTDYAKYPDIPGVPERLRRMHPRARMIYMMRHPVERALSQYRFEWLLGGRTMTFGEALAGNRGLLSYSRYFYQLEQWLTHFPSNQVLLVFTESFEANPEAEVQRVRSFLGLAPSAVVKPENPRSNETATLVRPSLARRLLRESWLGEFVRPVVPDAIVRRYRRHLNVKSNPEVSQTQMEAMIETFDRDLAQLSELVQVPGLTCANWLERAPTATPVLTTSSIDV